MTPAVASERSIFSKNHDWNSYSYRVVRVAVNTYVPIFRGVDARGGRKLYTNRHTRDSHSDDNNKRLFEALQLNRYNTTYSQCIRMQNRST